MPTTMAAPTKVNGDLGQRWVEKNLRFIFAFISFF